MLRILILLVSMPLFLSAQTPANHVYKVSGTVENFEQGDHVILSHYDPVSQIKTRLDTSIIASDGSYQIAYNFTVPDLFRLDFPKRQYTMLTIDVGQDDIIVNTEGKSGGSLTISGSQDSEKLIGYDRFRSESNRRLISPTYAAMRAARDANDVETEVVAVQAYVKASKEHRKELIDYTEQHIGSSFALYGTMLRWTGDDEVDRLDQLVSAFADKYPDIPATAAMQDKVARYKRVAVGVQAPALSAPTPGGSELSLSEIDGKYILIDFWASWCGPCISQIPDLKQVHEAFKGDGFEILSVSLDSREEKWKGAIEKHALDWLHISDVKGWQSKLGQDYNVTFVPFNFLVDSKGTIIAKNLHSKELYKTLEDLLKKS